MAKKFKALYEVTGPKGGGYQSDAKGDIRKFLKGKDNAKYRVTILKRHWKTLKDARTFAARLQAEGVKVTRSAWLKLPAAPKRKKTLRKGGDTPLEGKNVDVLLKKVKVGHTRRIHGFLISRLDGKKWLVNGHPMAISAVKASLRHGFPVQSNPPLGANEIKMLAELQDRTAKLTKRIEEQGKGYRYREENQTILQMLNKLKSAIIYYQEGKVSAKHLVRVANEFNAYQNAPRARDRRVYSLAPTSAKAYFKAIAVGRVKPGSVADELVLSEVEEIRLKAAGRIPKGATPRMVQTIAPSPDAIKKRRTAAAKKKALTKKAAAPKKVAKTKKAAAPKKAATKKATVKKAPAKQTRYHTYKPGQVLSIKKLAKYLAKDGGLVMPTDRYGLIMGEAQRAGVKNQIKVVKDAGGYATLTLASKRARTKLDDYLKGKPLAKAVKDVGLKASKKKKTTKAPAKRKTAAKKKATAAPKAKKRRAAAKKKVARRRPGRPSSRDITLYADVGYEAKEGGSVEVPINVPIRLSVTTPGYRGSEGRFTARNPGRKHDLAAELDARGYKRNPASTAGITANLQKLRVGQGGHFHGVPVLRVSKIHWAVNGVRYGLARAANAVRYGRDR